MYIHVSLQCVRWVWRVHTHVPTYIHMCVSVCKSVHGLRMHIQTHMFTCRCSSDARSLYDLADFYIQKLGNKYFENLKAAVASMGPCCLKSASVCSGTEIIKPSMEAVLRCYSEKYGLRLQADHAYTCELNPKKRNFILRNFPDIQHAYQDQGQIGPTPTCKRGCACRYVRMCVRMDGCMYACVYMRTSACAYILLKRLPPIPPTP